MAKLSPTSIIGLEMPNGRTVNVTVFQLLQWKHAVALEAKGLKVSRGSVSAHVKRQFGLKRSMRVQAVADMLADIYADVAQHVAD